MDVERIQLKGQLVEAKSKFKTLDAEASGLILLIRSYLNPFEDDITVLEIDKAVVSLNRLNEIAKELQTLKKKIESMEAYFD